MVKFCKGPICSSDGLLFHLNATTSGSNSGLPTQRLFIDDATIDEQRAPMSTILDETYKIAVTRFDKRIRVGGMAEVVGFNLNILKKRCETLKMVVQDLYQGGGDIAQAHFDGQPNDTGWYPNSWADCIQ